MEGLASSINNSKKVTSTSSSNMGCLSENHASGRPVANRSNMTIASDSRPLSNTCYDNLHSSDSSM